MDATKLLAHIPVGLRDPLLEHFRDIGRNYMEHRWEPAELNGGKFCEAVYTVIAGQIAGSFPPAPSKPKDMAAACWALEDTPADPTRVGDRSLRILIPRTLLPLYEIRNNRGVGHTGGDVNPNFLDATAVFGMASWVMAELVRIFHGVTTKEAQRAVDALIEFKHPLVWQIGDTRRVLDGDMGKADQTLVLLYGQVSGVSVSDLVKWTEYSTVSMYKTRVLEPLHKSRQIEFDAKAGIARISPLGTKDVEARLLPKLA